MRTPIIAFIICFALTVLSVVTQGFGSPITDITWFCAMMSLFVVPLVEVRHIHKRDEVEAGVAISCSARDFLWGFAAIAILLIPVAFGNHILRTDILGMHFQFDWSNYGRLEQPLYQEVLIQILAVALPEEFFYRGYLQTSFIAHFKKREKLSKYAPVPAIVLTSLLFSLAHLPSGNITRLLTFFPGCLFGFLRFKSGGLIAPILCHAACNLMMVILNVHYF